MSALARRSRRFHWLRPPRQHELLAAVLVLSIVVTVVGHVLRASGNAPARFSPAVAIAL
jgi:hypothetical protein